MKKVVIVANQFPPIGGSGVQRSAKFVKHLSKFGIEPIVFTRETKTATLIDKTLLNDIPKSTKIISTKAFEFGEFSGFLKIPGKALSKILIPDSSIIWARTSKNKLISLIKEDKINLIYTTSAPYSSHLLGLEVKKAIPKIKWVADFRDEWTNNPYRLDKGQNLINLIKNKIEKKMEKDVLKNADFLITNTPVMEQNFIKNNLDITNLQNKFKVIPNGYDEEDFYNLDLTYKRNEVFTIVYTGALYGRRKPDNVFEAIKNLIDKNKIDKNKIKLKLIGNYHKDKLQKQIENLNLKGQIKIIGYVPHTECIKEQLSGDALLLIEGSGVGAEAFYTGKIFEYMKTNRPVIACLPKGVASQLVKDTKIGKVANIDSVAEIEEVILNYYNMWLNKKINFYPNYDLIKNYERKVLTKDLANILLNL